MARMAWHFLSVFAILGGAPAVAGAETSPVDAAAPSSPLRSAAEAIDPLKDPVQSEAAWRAVLAEADAAGADAEITAMARNKIADALYYQQKPQDAVILVEAARASLIAADKGKTEAMAETLSNLGIMYSVTGRGEENLDLQKQSVAIREALYGADSPKMALALLNYATALYEGGQATAAAPIAERAALAFVAGPTKDSTVFLALASAANVNADGGRILTAIDLAQKAVVIANDTLPADHPFTGFSQATLAKVLMQSGRFEEAEGPARSAADILGAKMGPKNSHTLTAIHNLAYIAYHLGKPDEAEQLVLASANVMLDIRPEEAIKSLASAANYAAEAGRPADGLAHAEKAYSIAAARLPAEHQSRSDAARTLALHLESTDDHVRTLAMAREAAEMNAKTRPTAGGRDSASDLTLGGVEIAAATTQAERDAGWARMLAATAAIEKDMVAFAARSEVGEDLTSYYESFARAAEAAVDYGSVEDALRFYQFANWGVNARTVQQVALRKAAAGDVALAETIRRWQDDQRLVRQLTKERTAMLAAGFAKAADEAGAKIAAAEARSAVTTPLLERRIPDFGAWQRPDIATIARMRATLPAGDAVLVAMPSRNRLIVIAVTADKIAATTTDLNRGTLRQTVGRMRASVDATLRRETAPFAFAQAAALHSAVLQPAIRAILPTGGTLHVAAGDALSTISFAMLTDGVPEGADEASKLRGARWLLRDHAVSVPISLASIGGGSGDKSRRVSFAGIGAPSLTGDSGKPVELAGLYRGGAPDRGAIAALPALPAALGELRAMGRSIAPDRTLLLTGAGASESAVRAADIGKRTVLAFATHGLMGGEMGSLREPALVLTPPAADGASDSANDGLLTATEIASLRLDNDFVVLSACNTAAGRSGAAPAYSGLAHAFLYAGAKSLLLSNWPLRDDVAARLSSATVSGAADGQDKAQALRTAQLALIDDASVADGAHPALWAPFILIGQ